VLPLSLSVVHAATNLMHSMNCFQTSLIRLSVIVARTTIGRVSAMTFKKRKENAIRDDLQSSFYWHVVPISATWHIYIYITFSHAWNCSSVVVNAFGIRDYCDGRVWAIRPPPLPPPPPPPPPTMTTATMEKNLSNGDDVQRNAA